MQKTNKTIALLITALMVVSIGASIVTPNASAATTHKTFAYIEAAPHNVGVGDNVMIYMWIDKLFPNADMPNNYRFHDYKLTITRPDNTTETKTWETCSDTTSNQGYIYVPTMTGTYTIKFEFPQQNVNASDHLDDRSEEDPDGTIDDVYLASSATTTFTVQETSIGLPPDSYPLPNEYWTRPIYGENSYWFTISSNWLGVYAPGYGGFAGTYNMGGNGMLFPDDAIGPETSHVMWTKELQSGGVVGGDNFDGYEGNTYFEGSAYLQRYVNPIIVNGRIYYAEALSYLYPTTGGPRTIPKTVCVDLRTGEEIWVRNDITPLAFALIFDAENPNQHGVYNAMLVGTTGGFYGIGSTWQFYDADTGDNLFNATNCPTTGRATMGPMGERMVYQSDSQYGNQLVKLWNSSKLWTWSDTPTVASISLGWFSIFQGTTDASTAYEWKKPLTYNGNNWTSPYTIVEAYYGDSMLCYNGSLPSTGGGFFGDASQEDYTYFLVNLNETKGTIGSIRWMKTIEPDLNATILPAGVDPINRVFVENVREMNCFIGYDLDNGNRIWDTIDYPQTAMDYYGSPASGSLANMFAYGKMYSSAYAGIVYCYDTTDGSVVWTYGNGGPGNSTDSGFAVPGNYPTFINAYGNGILYLVTTEHTIETPLFKGSLLRAINATDGAEIWTINGYVGEFWQNSYAIADGYANWFNGLDNRIYTVGRGPSQMTVSAPDAGLASGQSVMIKGSVTDIASGTTQNEQAARFPNGVPVSSDACMKDWMGYVYQQKPLPTNFTGVEVVVNVVDANGNYRTIGTAQTDATGTYSLSWKPDISGDYKVIATFAGTKGYWPAIAEDAFVVDEPVATATPQPTQPPTAADLYFLPAIAGLFVAIVVSILLTALVLLKKHP